MAVPGIFTVNYTCQERLSRARARAGASARGRAASRGFLETETDAGRTGVIGGDGLWRDVVLLFRGLCFLVFPPWVDGTDRRVRQRRVRQTGFKLHFPANMWGREWRFGTG